MQIEELFSLDLLKQMVEEGYIRRQTHPTLPLQIFNYTEHAQFDNVWNSCTNACRGLIIDDYGVVIARPFAKFHNLNTQAVPETLAENLPLHEWPEVTEKLDGSLGIYWLYGLWPHLTSGIATRGSFTSEQAKWATEWAKNHARLDLLPRNRTAVFEIIYPENRIVVDYSEPGLVLLALIDKNTGEEMERNSLEAIAKMVQVPVVPKFVKSLEDVLNDKDTKNREGYVLTWKRDRQPPLKIKIKFEEYVRLHKIITGMNIKGIWEMLVAGQSFDELQSETLPEYFRDWVEASKEQLEEQFKVLENKALDKFNTRPLTDNRKETALYFCQWPEISSIMFAMLDKKDYKGMIWRQIKPKVELNVKEEEAS